MATSGAMVQLKVVKGGGAGSSSKVDCAKILASFVPPVEFDSHSQMQGSKRGYQAEHGGAVASAFHKRGRKGPTMPGCGNYSTSAALTWMVRDKQLKGTEHKILTDAMRKFSQRNDLAGKQATVSEWLKEYKKSVKDILRQRMKKAGQPVDEALLEKAAECVRQAFEDDLTKPKGKGKPPMTSMSTKLRNPWKATKEARAAAKKAAAAAKKTARGGAPR